MKSLKPLITLLCFYFAIPCIGTGHAGPAVLLGFDTVACFDFDGNTTSRSGNSDLVPNNRVSNGISFVPGLDGKAIRLGVQGFTDVIELKDPSHHFSAKKCFTVQFWVKTAMESSASAVILSQKAFGSKSLASQKNPGWVFYVHGGTWAWNMGTGDRRLTHESELPGTMPLNDGEWHQLTMTYDSKKCEVRLFYDGEQRALYNLQDEVVFDFSSESPLAIGSTGTDSLSMLRIRQEIEAGAENLQRLVDAFNSLPLKRLADDQFESLIVDPQGLVVEGSTDPNARELLDLDPINTLRDELMQNPNTIHQVRDFMRVAPLLQLYSLVDGKVTIDWVAANQAIEKQRLSPAEIDVDNLLITGRTLSAKEIAESYTAYGKKNLPLLGKSVPSIVVANWNIHHGGIHYTLEKDGWDSRMRIVELLKAENADVIMLQETYSLGAFIAAQLGFHYASTVDIDYLNQGTNISVLSRYPIESIDVPPEATFMNVGARINVSQTQYLYVMSNWYGMAKFPAVFEFHKNRFSDADELPVIFAGDFNAVPHLDGGESMASTMLADAGFTDAYREWYPSVDAHPGYTHDSNRRIDQLYYKGDGLRNTDTKIISHWPTGFPSDHSLIISTFDLFTN